MANVDIFSSLYAKNVSPLDFNWDTMVAPPLLSLITPQDIYTLNQIAKSNRLASKPEEKYKLIRDVLVPRGFKKTASGTNRVIYKYLEDQRYCLKIAIDRVGLKDNPEEFQNQFKLKPFVTRTFEVSPCGTVALAERVEPITTREEYLHVIDDVFNLLVEKIIGKYVVDDIGTNFFQNIGIRRGFGVVLLDYPYVYELDGSKMYCNWMNPDTHEYCLGEIDYDDGFNYLICSKCGKQYQARQLAKQVENRAIVVEKKGVTKAMKISLMRGDEVVKVISTENESVTTARKNEHIVSGVKILNKKNFDQRQKDATSKEEDRLKAIKDARKRREERVSKNINESLNNLAKSDYVQEEDQPDTIVIDAAEAAERINPSYMETGRYPRTKKTEGEGLQTESSDVNEYVERIHSEIIQEEQNSFKDEAPVVETKVEVDESSDTEDDFNNEDNLVSKEELLSSTWDNPCKVTSVVFDIDDDDVSANY